ncbi:MAG TPA: HAMP domain-containing sensor histidine kinase [Vicinamibacteria bacterium]|nr:HAMP domain-containing sensor histidine kinase [Vicinamibacteria bacterium]
MTLRRRLTLTLVLATGPLVAGALWLRNELQRRAVEDALRESLLARMEAGGRERCEEDPSSFSGRRLFRGRERPPPDEGGGPAAAEGDRRHRPRRRFWTPPLTAYDASFRPADPAAPPLPETVQRALRSGDEAASERRHGGILVAVRMPWDEGPCAVVAAFRPTPPQMETAPGLLAGALALCGGFLAAVWLASGPVVRRIRALGGDVRRSASSHYETPVPVTGNDEVTQLARAFNEAGSEVRAHLAQVEEREATLRTFVANTTHDVMLPLTVLQGHLAQLRKEAAAGTAGERRLGAAAEEAHYIGSLLQNLSAAAKLETGAPLERHPFDLSALVERVVERHRPLAEAAGIALAHAVPETPLWARGDVTLVEQAVGNVVHNAIRHNARGGHVAVVLDEEGAQAFRLRVSDDGPGVPAEHVGRLGERRFRAPEARARHPEGLGLGLSIARDVADRHGFALDFVPNVPAGLAVELRGPAPGAGGAPGAAGNADV